MAYDERDEIWKATWNTYYDSFYQELLAEKMVIIWQRVDEIARFIIALTASGSAIAGWALWSSPEYKNLWAIIAGLGALLAIVQRAFDITKRLSEWGNLRSFFSSLRIDLDTFQYHMKFDPSFPIPEFTKEFDNFRKRYTEGFKGTKTDILLISYLKNKTQRELNQRIHTTT
jgi:hypothetical protein